MIFDPSLTYLIILSFHKFESERENSQQQNMIIFYQN